MRQLALATCLSISVALVAAPALAQSDADRATARTLGQQGAEALEAKSYAKALDLFSRANKLYKAPTLTLGLARALAGSGKLVAAAEAYNTLARQGAGPSPSPAFTKAVEDGAKELAALEPRIGKVVLTVKGPTEASITSITIDGEAVPPAALGIERPIDPGDHTAVVAARGFAPGSQRFVIAEGQGSAVAIALLPGEGPVKVDASTTPIGAPSSSWRKTVGFVSIGVGGAGLIVGAITGLVAIGKKSTLDDDCAQGHCPTSDQGTLDGFHAMGTVSTIGFVAGGVLAAGGVALVLTAPKATATATTTGARVAPFVGPGFAGLKGAF